MARGSKPKKVEGPRGTVWKMTVDVGVDPATGKRKQKKLTAASKQELEKMAAQALADASRGVYFEPEKITFREYMDYWLENYGKQNLKPKTLMGYKSIIETHLKPALGSVPIGKLLPAHIQKYYTEAIKGGRKDNKQTKARSLSTTTVLHHARLIGELLSHAVKWEIIQRNVAEAVKPPKQARTEIKALIKDQVDKILVAVNGTYLYMATFLAVCTGMRLGEVLGLRWEDVTLREGKGKEDKDSYLSVNQTLQQTDEGLIFGPPKSKYSKRRIELSPQVVAALKTHRTEQKKQRLAAGKLWQDHGLICCRQDGRPVPIANFSGYWKNVAKRAGVEAHFHQLRHTAATMMLEAGVPLHRVSKMLGHSSVAITGDVYGHVTPAGQKEAAGAERSLVWIGRVTDVTSNRVCDLFVTYSPING